MDYKDGNDAREYLLDYASRIRALPLFESSPNPDFMLLILLMIRACTVKKPAFRSEAEFRIILIGWMRNLFGLKFPQENIFHDCGRNIFRLPLIQYPDFDFDLRPQSIISRIILGPKGDVDRRKQRIKDFLKERDLSDIPVVVSDVPLV